MGDNAMLFKYDEIMFDNFKDVIDYPELGAYITDREYFDRMIKDLEYVLCLGKKFQQEFAEAFEKAMEAETVNEAGQYFDQMDEAIEAMEDYFEILNINCAEPNGQNYTDIFAKTVKDGNS